jgi:hypothetical protein
LIYFSSIKLHKPKKKKSQKGGAPILGWLLLKTGKAICVCLDAEMREALQTAEGNVS